MHVNVWQVSVMDGLPCAVDRCKMHAAYMVSTVDRPGFDGYVESSCRSHVHLVVDELLQVCA